MICDHFRCSILLTCLWFKFQVFTFKQNKMNLIFIISSWAISYKASPEVKIPAVIHAGDIYRPYTWSDLLNQMLYKLQKDITYALKSLIIQSAALSRRKYLWYTIINYSVSLLAFSFSNTLHNIFLFISMILASNRSFISKLLLQNNLCYKCHWSIFQ